MFCSLCNLKLGEGIAAMIKTKLYILSFHNQCASQHATGAFPTIPYSVFMAIVLISSRTRFQLYTEILLLQKYLMLRCEEYYVARLLCECVCVCVVVVVVIISQLKSFQLL